MKKRKVIKQKNKKTILKKFASKLIELFITGVLMTGITYFMLELVIRCFIIGE